MNRKTGKYRTVAEHPDFCENATHLQNFEIFEDFL